MRCLNEFKSLQLASFRARVFRSYRAIGPIHDKLETRVRCRPPSHTGKLERGSSNGNNRAATKLLIRFWGRMIDYKQVLVVSSLLAAEVFSLEESIFWRNN